MEAEQLDGFVAALPATDDRTLVTDEAAGDNVVPGNSFQGAGNA